jgi:hypothetical protein
VTVTVYGVNGDATVGVPVINPVLVEITNPVGKPGDIVYA